MSVPFDPAALLRQLLADTRASRATLRLDLVGMNFPIVAEAVAEGVSPLSGDQSLDQRRLETVTYLFETRKVLVQDDTGSADPRPPKELIQAYGVRAQVLAPIVHASRVSGWVSLHECSGPREWLEPDIAAVRGVALHVQEVVGPQSQS